jgi:hypothetical protein
MQAIDHQLRAALAFAFAFVIVRVLSLVVVGQSVNVPAVLATYLLLGGVALVLRHSLSDVTDVKLARTMSYITFGALAATAPEFW